MREKRKNFARAAPRKEEGDKGGKGEAYTPPLSTLSYLKSRCNCNHFEKCIDPSTVIIIEKNEKSRKHFMRTEFEGETNLFFFFLLTYTPLSLLVSQEMKKWKR